MTLTEQRDNYLHRSEAVINHIHIYMNFLFFLSLNIVLYRFSTFSFRPAFFLFMFSFLRPCTRYHLLLTCFSSTVAFPCKRGTQPCKLTHYRLTHTPWIINDVFCSIDSVQVYLFGQAGRQAWLIQSRPHMGPLHAISHLSLLSTLYIWLHLLTTVGSLLRFLFIGVLLSPRYFLIFFVSPCLPCGVSIWRSDTEGHSKGERKLWSGG